MGKGYEFSDDGMPLHELAPGESAPPNSNPGRKRIPATVIVDTMMRERASFIDDMTNQSGQGEK